MSKYQGPEASAEALDTRLDQLLEQEGQPCSYCIAVFLTLERGEKLPPRDRALYSRHLIWEHGSRPYRVEP